VDIRGTGEKEWRRERKKGIFNPPHRRSGDYIERQPPSRLGG